MEQTVHKHPTGTAMIFTILVKDRTNANALIDPDTIVIRERNPRGVVTDQVPTSHPSTGTFTYRALMDIDGRWQWEIRTSGNVASVGAIEGFAVAGILPVP